jgi:hypothetical protein
MFVPTMRDPATRASLIQRLHRVQPDAKALWGSFTAPQMMAHLSDAFRMALGELPIKSRNIWLAQRFPAKHIFLYLLTFPKGAPSAKELLSRAPKPFEEERADVIHLMEKMAQQGPDAERAEHAIFGRLTHHEWGVLGHKHTDHHLRQFGV